MSNKKSEDIDDIENIAKKIIKTRTALEKDAAIEDFLKLANENLELLAKLIDDGKDNRWYVNINRIEALEDLDFAFSKKAKEKKKIMQEIEKTAERIGKKHNSSKQHDLKKFSQMINLYPAIAAELVNDGKLNSSAAKFYTRTTVVGLLAFAAIIAGPKIADRAQKIVNHKENTRSEKTIQKNPKNSDDTLQLTPENMIKIMDDSTRQ